MQLVIVESPKKAKTIERFLGGKFKVLGSNGHVRGLPEKRFAVDVDNNFEPTYVIEPKQKKKVEELQEYASKADLVYLATDPDREGEAIAWHLYEVLGIKGKTHRIKFNEISEKAVKAAISKPERIDYNLVDSQQARRILDRIVGYKLSPFVRTRVKDGESAGRVQSVAVRLAVELERKILNFVPQEYWNISAKVKTSKDSSEFKIALYEKSGKKFKPSNEQEALEVYDAIKNSNFVVSDVKKSVVKAHALPPFTTSTMQQDGASKLGLSAPQIMQLAQHLYEGVETQKGHLALVTYIRTDSTRISQDAQNDCLAYIEKNFGKEYLPSKPNVYASKKNSQDAHEAIRPIDISVTPESVKGILDKNHYNLYKLIYERYLASQMAEAQYNSMKVAVNAGEYGFKASGKSVKFKGYTAVYDFAVIQSGDDEDDNGKLLPNMEVGETLLLKKLDKEQKFTKPPVRYTDSTLVKAIEDNGIGRPSTYATIIGTLTKRKFIARKGKYLVPTQIAFDATDLLVKYFSDIMDVGFTAKMEDKLDDVAEGKNDWRKVVGDFYNPFISELKIAASDNNEETDIVCEHCGAFYVKKKGRFGEFLYCPTCKKTKNPDDKVSEVACPNCGENMILREGKYGKYLSCPNAQCGTKMQQGDEISNTKCSCGAVMLIKSGKFGKYVKCTKCNVTKSLTEQVGVCPVCGKSAQKMISKKGTIYYGCSGYPNCNFRSWDVPTGKMCPVCGNHLVLKDNQVKCSLKDCSYVEAKKEN